MTYSVETPPDIANTRQLLDKEMSENLRNICREENALGRKM